MATKATIVKELKAVRKAYGLNVEKFAETLSTHMKEPITPERLTNWEKAHGPSSRFREKLEPILKRFRKHLEAGVGGKAKAQEAATATADTDGADVAEAPADEAAA